MSWPTAKYYQGPNAAHRRAVYKGIGLTDRDLEQPLIAVVSTFSEVCPGHMHLKNVVQSVKNGIWQAGGTPLEFSTISQCATQTLGLPGIRYDLACRELIALDVETITETQLFDGIVLITTCDKTTPGALLGASRLDLPTIIVPGGIMNTGEMNGKRVSLSDLDEKVFSGVAEGMPARDLKDWEDQVIPGCGACPIMGTANTMQVLAEAVGLTLPHASTKLAGTAAQLRLAKLAGNQIVDLVKENVKFSDIVTPPSMKNMVRVAMSVGCASNSILHMLALAHDMGYEKEINIDFIDQVSQEVPCLLNVKPVGEMYLTDLERIGGMPKLFKHIRNILDGDCLTVSGHTIDEICTENISPSAPGLEEAVIKTSTEPVMKNGGVIILRGNLADSSVMRAFKHSGKKFRGTAKVFGTQEEAIEAVRAGKIVNGDVIVLRFMGPKGGPGMPDCFGTAAAVTGAGLEEMVAVITDGRFSGFAKGVGICQMCPEAAEGGPLAKVKDGDPILIDAETSTISDLAEDFESRTPAPCPPTHEKGILRIYRKIAGPAMTGARL